jgi:hypothetical protein
MSKPKYELFIREGKMMDLICMQIHEDLTYMIEQQTGLKREDWNQDVVDAMRAWLGDYENDYPSLVITEMAYLADLVEEEL